MSNFCRADKSTVITLTCGVDINCLEAVRTIKRRIKIGNVVEGKFASHMVGECCIKEAGPQIIREYNKAATKADILMLVYEIMKLRNKIGNGGGEINEKM